MSCYVVAYSVSTMPYCDIMLSRCESTVFIMLPQWSLVILQRFCNKCDIRVPYCVITVPICKTTLTWYGMTGTYIFSVKSGIMSLQCPSVISLYCHTMWSHSYCFFTIVSLLWWCSQVHNCNISLQPVVSIASYWYITALINIVTLHCQIVIYGDNSALLGHHNDFFFLPYCCYFIIAMPYFEISYSITVCII